MSNVPSKGVKPAVKPEGPAELMSQRQFYSRTGQIKTAAQAGAAGKPSTPKNY